MNTVSHDEAAHQFATLVEGHRAILDYTLSGSVMSITHTWVPREIGGRGVAADLMRAAVAHAHAQQWTVNPVCSYAAAYWKRHPS